MIQFNLLPDVKLAFIKAERTKRLVMGVSVIASAAALAIMVLLLLSVDGVQRKSLSDLKRDIATNSKNLQDTPDINKVLTIQNQLGALTGLHDKKPAAFRLFGYLTQVTPAKSTISNANIDYTADTATISGDADSLSTINTFVDTLKFTTYVTTANTSPTKAFSQVVLASFTPPVAAAPATYNITFTFDPAIFDGTADPVLTVPQTVTTRSVTDQPTDLFKQDKTTSGQ